MKKLIYLLSLGLVGCGTGNPLASQLEDYQGNDASILQIKNYLDATISFYEKDNIKNCLYKTETKVMNNAGLFNRKKYRMNYDSPFAYLGKSVVEYNLKPNQYIRLSMKPHKHWINKDIDFKIEANKYYLLDVHSNGDNYTYRIIDVPKGKEKLFSSLDATYDAKSWDLKVCN